MKPDWKDAPAWANYLAMDSDGAWTWFELKPNALSQRNIWETANYEGRSRHAGMGVNWIATLESRPQS